MFWRCKLAYLSHVDGMRFLREKIRQLVSEEKTKAGISSKSSGLFSMKRFSLDEFSKEIVTAIDDVYNDFTNEHFRDDAFRIFDDFTGIRFLQQNGWEIANHSCSHYPAGEDSHINHFSSDFEICEEAIRQNLGISTRYWVVPFDRAEKRSRHIFTTFEQADDQKRHLVFVGNKSNLNPQIRHRALYRIGVPEVSGSELVRYLKNIRPFESDA